MKILFYLILFSAIACSQQNLPIIDMHLHAHSASINGPAPTAICAPPVEMPYVQRGNEWGNDFIKGLKDPPCDNPIWGPATDEEVMTKTIEILNKYNIYGVTSGPLLDNYIENGGERIIPGLGFSFFNKELSVEKVRELLSSGKYKVFGEVGIQYNGVSPSDSSFEPYAEIAEELDIPVGIHIGTGPPGAVYLPGMGNYRAKLHSPLIVEELLLKHPGLRIYLMHAGWPMLDDLLVVLWTYPQVYVDVGVICYAIPRAAFHSYLKRIVEAGFGKRVMFGSDQMNWPETIAVGIEAIETADFLTEEQKRDILYNNAARFLNLTETEITKHYGE